MWLPREKLAVCVVVSLACLSIVPFAALLRARTDASLNTSLIPLSFQTRAQRRKAVSTPWLDSDGNPSVPANPSLSLPLSPPIAALYAAASAATSTSTSTVDAEDTIDCALGDGLLLPETLLPPSALASYPGSGNTWTRVLLESASGIVTSSVYNDSDLVAAGMKGEALEVAERGRALVVKTHRGGRAAVGEDVWRKCVLLVRSPFDALVSKFHYFATSSHTHEGSLAEWLLYKNVIAQEASLWARFIDYWISPNRLFSFLVLHDDVLVVRYEDLKADPALWLGTMFDYLGLEVPPQRIACAIKQANKGHLRRSHSWLPVFSASERAGIEAEAGHVLSRFDYWPLLPGHCSLTRRGRGVLALPPPLPSLLFDSLPFVDTVAPDHPFALLHVVLILPDSGSGVAGAIAGAIAGPALVVPLDAGSPAGPGAGANHARVVVAEWGSGGSGPMSPYAVLAAVLHCEIDVVLTVVGGDESSSPSLSSSAGVPDWIAAHLSSDTGLGDYTAGGPARDAFPDMIVGPDLGPVFLKSSDRVRIVVSRAAAETPHPDASHHVAATLIAAAESLAHAQTIPFNLARAA